MTSAEIRLMRSIIFRYYGNIQVTTINLNDAKLPQYLTSASAFGAANVTALSVLRPAVEL